jgi:replicative DNA helicase
MHDTAIESRPPNIAELLPELLCNIDYLRHGNNRSKETSITTGFSDLDYFLTELPQNILTVIAARPSMGKEMLARNIATHVALYKALPVVFFSMELSAPSLLQQLISQVGGVSYYQLHRGMVDESEWGKITVAAGRLSNADIYIDDDAHLDVKQIVSRVQSIYEQQGKLGLVVIDCLELMALSNPNERSRSMRQIMIALKNLARQVNAPVILISDLNRKIENRKDKRPCTHDLKDGAIAKMADLILFPYNEAVYDPDTPSKGSVEIYIGKNRYGSTGTMRLKINGAFARFESYVEESNESIYNQLRLELA